MYEAVTIVHARAPTCRADLHAPGATAKDARDQVSASAAEIWPDFNVSGSSTSTAAAGPRAAQLPPADIGRAKTAVVCCKVSGRHMLGVAVQRATRWWPTSTPRGGAERTIFFCEWYRFLIVVIMRVPLIYFGKRLSRYGGERGATSGRRRPCRTGALRARHAARASRVLAEESSTRAPRAMARPPFLLTACGFAPTRA